MMEAFYQNEEGSKGLFSVNEERQSLIEEPIEAATMVIKGSSISGKEKIIQMEGRINLADKIVFYVNIVFFVLLTIMNIAKIQV